MRLTEDYELAIARGQLLLGRYTTGRRAVQQARRLGIGPVAAGWIGEELALAEGP